MLPDIISAVMILGFLGAAFDESIQHYRQKRAHKKDLERSASLGQRIPEDIIREVVELVRSS